MFWNNKFCRGNSLIDVNDAHGGWVMRYLLSARSVFLSLSLTFTAVCSWAVEVKIESGQDAIRLQITSGPVTLTEGGDGLIIPKWMAASPSPIRARLCFPNT